MYEMIYKRMTLCYGQAWIFACVSFMQKHNHGNNNTKYLYSAFLHTSGLTLPYVGILSRNIALFDCHISCESNLSSFVNHHQHELMKMDMYALIFCAKSVVFDYFRIKY